ncbi:MAG: hypothetical protein OXB95_09240, partial [Rhodobacteraceae bacterium]|nr:hypothetical protein [Paracoccaceae bacterium]
LTKSDRRMLPSTAGTVSALWMTEFSALNGLACMYRCRRFATALTDSSARLAGKLVVNLSFLGTFTQNTYTS